VDHQIVFDRVNNQIGWASTTCWNPLDFMREAAVMEA
jgi:hypothetical protein